MKRKLLNKLSKHNFGYKMCWDVVYGDQHIPLQNKNLGFDKSELLENTVNQSQRTTHTHNRKPKFDNEFVQNYFYQIQ